MKNESDPTGCDCCRPCHDRITAAASTGWTISLWIGLALLGRSAPTTMVAQPPTPPPAPDEPTDTSGDDAALIDRGLSPRQEQAILALLNEASVSKAATACGVPERTIYNWLDDPKFSKAFRGSRRQAFGHAISLMQHYAPMAAQTLAKVMTDPHAPHSARVSAANNLLRGARESIEMDEMAARIDALEKAQDATIKAAGGKGNYGNRY